MAQKISGEASLLPQESLQLRILEALPYGVSWARLPGAEIQYCNSEFERIFGYDRDYFRTADSFIDEAYLHEHQREESRACWFNFGLPVELDTHVVADMEIEILARDGTIRTVLHSGLILPREKVAVAIFKDITDIESSRRQFRDFAHRDDLTGVANRRGLRERWRNEMAVDATRKLAFLMIDLDDFKKVNDVHGHAVGDLVLRTVADRLRLAVRDSDLICRLGGDEFGILLVAPGGFDHLNAVCSRIVELVVAPIPVEGGELSIGVSVGGCLYPDQAVDKRQLLQRADMALYQIKKTEKGAWNWFSGGVAVDGATGYDIPVNLG